MLGLNRKSRLLNFSTPIACLQQIRDASRCSDSLKSLALKEFERDATLRCYSKNLSVDLIEDGISDITICNFNPFDNLSRDFPLLCLENFSMTHYRRLKRIPQLSTYAGEKFSNIWSDFTARWTCPVNPIPLYPVVQRYRMTAVSITSRKERTCPDISRRWKMEMVARCDSLDATPQNFRSWRDYEIYSSRRAILWQAPRNGGSLFHAREKLS